MTTFDLMLPTGIAMTDRQQLKHGPARQSTSFSNEMGIDYTLSCDRVSSVLTRLFHEDQFKTYTPDMTDLRGNANPVEQCLMSYSTTNDDDEEGDESRGMKAERDDTPTVYYRNKFMRNNFYYNNDLMANNIIAVILNQTSPLLQDLLGIQAGAAGSAEGPILYVKNVVSDYLSRNKRKLNDTFFLKIYNILYAMTNFDAVTYLRYINIGFSVIWVKPQFVQADSMLLCRPSGFAHFGGAPIQSRINAWSDESNTIQYNTKAYSTTNRQSMGGYPSIMWHNAAMIESQVTSTDTVINTVDESDMSDTLNYLTVTKSAGVNNKTFNSANKMDGWWPLFAPPFMEKHFFSQAVSPLVRFVTQFSSPEEHATNFTDQDINDCITTNVFTTNAVFNDMWNNFNTIVLYSKSLFQEKEDLPFYKYINYNPTANEALNGLTQSITRSSNDTINMRRNDEEGIPQADETNLSHLLGAAIPKTCWSNSEMEEVLVRNDVKSADSYRVNSAITTGVSLLKGTIPSASGTAVL